MPILRKVRKTREREGDGPCAVSASVLAQDRASRMLHSQHYSVDVDGDNDQR